MPALPGTSWLLGARQPTGMSDCSENVYGLGLSLPRSLGDGKPSPYEFLEDRLRGADRRLAGQRSPATDAPNSDRQSPVKGASGAVIIVILFNKP
jgi:hypothetical protein